MVNGRLPLGLRGLLALLAACLTVLGPLGLAARAGEGTAVVAMGGSDTSAPAKPSAKAKLLELVMMDVGQGDGLVLRSPQGKVVLIDAGPRDAAAAVLADLDAMGITGIDLAIGSHPHEDHIGGMAAVLEAHPTKRYVDPGFAHTTVTYQNVLRTLERQQVEYAPARRGQRFDLKDGVSLTVLGPEEPLLEGTRSDANSNSVVVRVEYGQFSALLVGDGERETELRLLAGQRELPLRSTVLKVGHHGSRYSSYADFLDAVGPTMALISVGTGNSYGHPGKSTLNKLDRRGIRTFRSDERGTVRLRSDGDWVWVDAMSAVSYALPTGSPPTWTATPLGVFPAKVSEATRTALPGEDDEGGPSVPQEPEDPHASERAAPPPVEKGASAGAPPGAEVGAGFVASASSKVFHKSSCGNAARISPQNLRRYDTRDAAIGDGRKPAQCCHP